MTWSTYKITSKTMNKQDGVFFSENYIRFFLDGRLSYNDGEKSFINTKATHPFCDWEKNDEINIDTTRIYNFDSKYRIFSLNDNIIYFASSHWKIKYHDLCDEKDKLEREVNEWKKKYNDKEKECKDKNRDYEEYKERYGEVQEELSNLKDERIRETQENTTDRLRQEEEKSALRFGKARLEEKLESAKARIFGLEKLLEDTKAEKNNQVMIFENKLDRKQQRLEEVHQLLENLQVNYEKDQKQKDIEHEREKFQKDSEIEQQKAKVEGLKEKLILSREEKISLKKGKLEIFASGLNVDLEKVKKLRGYHEEIVRSRQSYNRSNVSGNERKITSIFGRKEKSTSIENIDNKITRIKQELSKVGVKIEKIQKICKKCEKLAELRLELEQYQVQQEQPTK